MYLFFKRLADIFLALFVMLLTAPLWLILIILLKLTAEGEVFYSQKRIGFKNKNFLALKFATMVKNSLNLGTGSITLRNDPRVTPIGKYLRKSKLNEVPQILNVLKGDMSIVGPRPLVQATFDAYSTEVQSKIYNVKPGVTGIGSVIFRDEEKYISESERDPKEYYNSEIAPFKGELEMWYLEHISFSTDLKIIVLTAYMIFFPNSKITSNVFPSVPKHPIFNP